MQSPSTVAARPRFSLARLSLALFGKQEPSKGDRRDDDDDDDLPRPNATAWLVPGVRLAGLSALSLG